MSRGIYYFVVVSLVTVFKEINRFNLGAKAQFTCKKEELKIVEEESIVLENLNILMVEDNKTNQTFLKLLLDEHKVDIANDGNEGFEMRTKNSYDIILMDLKMPHCGGIESSQKIREYEKENTLEPIPIIAVSANAFDDDKSACEEAGINGFCSKPIDEDVLFKEMQRVLKKGYKKVIR